MISYDFSALYIAFLKKLWCHSRIPGTTSERGSI